MDGQLPHNLGAERALLGAIFLDNDIMFEVAGTITKEDFYEPGNGEIFILLKDQIEANRAATPQTILADMAQDADIGGIRASEYLNTLWNERAPTREVAKELARGIFDNALKRRMMTLGQMLIDDCRSAPVSTAATTIRDRFDLSLQALFAGLKDLGIRHIADYAADVITEIEATLKADIERGLPLGITALQDLIGPLMPGRLYSIAGAPGSGKSALAQQVLEFIAEHRNVLWVQAEMEGGEVAARSLSNLTGISGVSIERGMVSLPEAEKLMAATERMRAGRLYVDASTQPTVQRIRARAIRMKRLQGLDAIGIDHLHYLGKPNDRMTDIEAIPYNMRELKALAKDLGIPIIVLMALKSTYADSTDLRRPRLGDLTHPAAIDQNSDAIVFVHRPEYILRRNPLDPSDRNFAEWQINIEKWANLAEFILAKRRGGEGTGERKAFFDKTKVRFSDNVQRQFYRAPEDQGVML